MLEASTEPVDAPARRAAAASSYIDRAVYCPPIPQGTAAKLELIASRREDGAIEMGFEPSDGDTLSLSEGEAVVPEVQMGEPVDVVGFGAFPAASVTTRFKSKFKGLAAAACAPAASREWFFPAGSSANGFDQRLVLYNPFPDEAVVRVTFFTGGGELNKAGLADVPVPSRDTTSISVNRFLLQRRSLGIKIDALRGRITAWKTVSAKTENRPTGVTSTLGATEPATLWYFPSGAVGEGNEERISLLNPSGQEALVAISIVTDQKTVQPPDLREIKVPRGSELDVKLRAAINEKLTGSVSVVVRSLNKVGIVAERSVFYGAGEFTGYASEIGATTSAQNWWLGAPGTGLEADAIVVYNPGQQPADIEVTLSGAGGEVPGAPPQTTVAAGSRLRIPLQELTRGEAAVAHLQASAPVVAERVGYSALLKDVSALMGLPLPPP